MTGPAFHAQVTGPDGAFIEVDAYTIGAPEVCLEMRDGHDSVVEFFPLPAARQIRDALSAAIAHQEALS